MTGPKESRCRSAIHISLLLQYYILKHYTSGGSKGWPGGHAPPPVRALPLPYAPYKTGCKVARLHNTCIHSVASHSWCQITPLTQSYTMSSGIPSPQIQMWPSRWPRQTAADRNAPGLVLLTPNSIQCQKMQQSRQITT